MEDAAFNSRLRLQVTIWRKLEVMRTYQFRLR
jgi:hypothetical protein